MPNKKKNQKKVSSPSAEAVEFELPELSSSSIHDLVSGHFVMVRSFQVRSFQSIVSSLHKIVKSFRKIVSSSHICYIYFLNV